MVIVLDGIFLRNLANTKRPIRNMKNDINKMETIIIICAKGRAILSSSLSRVVKYYYISSGRF